MQTDVTIILFMIGSNKSEGVPLTRQSPKKFAEIVLNSRPKDLTPAPLLNVTVFMGAGFAKAWDERCPIGSDLFSFAEEMVDRSDRLNLFLDSQGYNRCTLRGLTATQLKDIVYSLGMQAKYEGIRTRYVDQQTVQLVLKELRFLVQQKFEATVPLNYFDGGAWKFPPPNRPSNDQKAILRFFRNLRDCMDGSQGIPEGVRCHFITTNYDFTLETILDALLGDDDSLFLYTYRGVTPSVICGRDNEIVPHSHSLVENLIKLNGGFEILSANQMYDFEYRQRERGQLMAQPPVIMLPSREQDYTDAYFRAVFPKAVRLLQESHVLVIVGYSMPKEDSLLRFLLRQFAEHEGDLASKHIFYVDTMESSDQERKLQEVYPYLSGGPFPHCVVHSGGFAKWASAVSKKIS
jgi:hypothetical protein